MNQKLRIKERFKDTTDIIIFSLVIIFGFIFLGIMGHVIGEIILGA